MRADQQEEEEEPGADSEKRELKKGVSQGVNRGVERGVNLRVERGAEKRELRGVDKGVMEQRITSIIINSCQPNPMF